MAQWLSWLERRPVTAEVESSSLFWVAYLSHMWVSDNNLIWDHSSAGRASALQAEGHRFEPYWSHFVIIVCHDSQVLESRNVTRCFASMHTISSESARFTLYAAVAELADAQDLKSCGTYTPVPVRFRSSAPYFSGPLAQLVRAPGS